MRLRSLLLLVAATVMGCGSTVPATGTPGPTGIVRISVQRADGSHVIFGSEQRVRIATADGTVAFDGQLAEGAVTTAVVPIGTAILSTSTVFFADILVCPSVVADAPVPTCFRPTLGPSQVCEIPIEVQADVAVDARFTVLADGRCRVAVASPAGASPSPT